MKKLTKTIIRRTFIALLSLGLFSNVLAFANDSTIFNLTISAGVRDLKIVNSSDNVETSSPAVSFNGINYSSFDQTTEGTLGISDEVIRFYNPTGNSNGFSIDIAVSGGTTNYWTDGGSNNQLSYNNTNSKGYLEFSSGTITGNAGSTTAPGGSMNGVSSVNLAINSSSDTPTYGYIDFSGYTVTQHIPGNIPANSYSLTMSITLI